MADVFKIEVQVIPTLSQSLNCAFNLPFSIVN